MRLAGRMSVDITVVPVLLLLRVMFLLSLRTSMIRHHTPMKTGLRFLRSSKMQHKTGWPFGISLAQLRYCITAV